MHNMTHEFKTPLSNVNLALDTIEKKMGDVNDKVDVKLLKIIREENLRLQDNVNLILNTAFYEQKEIPLNKEILDINKIVKNFVRYHRRWLYTGDGDDFSEYSNVELKHPEESNEKSLKEWATRFFRDLDKLSRL